MDGGDIDGDGRQSIQQAELVAVLAGAWAAEEIQAGDALTVGARLEAARKAWPEVRLSRLAFLEHVALCVGRRDPSDPLARIAGFHLADLYLACGCLAGDTVAIRGLDPLFQAVPSIVRSLSTDPGFAGDVRETVAEDLLVRKPGKNPKLARYSGEGSLRSWFTVVVQRTALGLKKAGAAMQPVAEIDDFPGLLTGRFDPELEFLASQFLPQLQSAMRAAAARMTRRERLILRLSMVDGVTMQQIADSYQVNQSTISRWIGCALDGLHEDVRRLLRERHDLRASEVDSLMAAVRSRFEVSLPGLLGTSLTRG